MEYIMMEIPSGMFTNEKITKKEVRQRFEYYVSQSNSRIDYLHSYIKDTGTNIELDYSPESLIDLWRWYEDQIEVVKKTEEEWNDEISQYPNWMKDWIPREDLSMKTMKISLDVSFYFAEVMIRNNNKIEWGYFTSPKNRIGVNMPVLLGFVNGVDLDPRRIVDVCTRKSTRGKDECRLFNIYNTWLEYIPT
ncbi:MAG: hypothetical protein K5662_06710 [Lachnospiraceae bacterium]|nr:hypothetical protein [Lachnospiraceae bacterium]